MDAVTVRRPSDPSERLGDRWRAIIGVAAVLNLAAAAYLTTQPSAVIDRWPWELTRLSVLFLAAMLAALGVAAVWIAASGQRGALPAGFLNLAVTLGGIALWLARTDPDRRSIATALGALAVVNVALFVRTHRAPRSRAVPVAAPDPPPSLPGPVRWSFVAYVVVLLTVGIVLITGGDGIVPWHLGEGTAEVFGWIFVGDACFFAYALRWPSEDAGRAQLWAFLGYDLVLLGPLAATATTVAADQRVNLALYLAVLVQSAGLALWVLVVRPATRGRTRSAVA